MFCHWKIAPARMTEKTVSCNDRVQGQTQSFKSNSGSRKTDKSQHTVPVHAVCWELQTDHKDKWHYLWDSIAQAWKVDMTNHPFMYRLQEQRKMTNKILIYTNKNQIHRNGNIRISITIYKITKPNVQNSWTSKNTFQEQYLNGNM